MQNTSLPLCSEKEQWMKDDKFAVKKTANKRAMRVFDSMDDAQNFLTIAVSTTHSIEVRKGAATRCDQNLVPYKNFVINT